MTRLESLDRTFVYWRLRILKTYGNNKCFPIQFCSAFSRIVMENNEQKRNTLQWLLCGSIGLYLLMVGGAFLVHLWVMLIPIKNSLEIKSSPETLDKLVRDYVEKEVDRSYGRFFTQFNFAIFLIGTSVWIFRQSVISQLKADVEKDVGERLRKELEETIRKDVKEEADKQVEAEVKSKVEQYLTENKIAGSLEEVLSLDRKFKAQLEKSRIFEELSIFIPPEEVFFQEQTDSKIQERLEKLVSELTDHIHLHKESLSLTVDDYIKLGDALYCLENYEEAEKQYKNAIKEHFDAYRALFGIGNALLRQGEKQQRKRQDKQAEKLFQEAIEYYNQAIDINPYYFVAYVNKGLVNKRWMKSSAGLKAAIECLDKAIHISPNYYRAWYNKACYYALLSDSEEATKCLKKAITIAPKQCKDLAEKDEDFFLIKDNEEFKNLIPDYNAKCEQNS